MGMAASQARYLGLTARKTNCEYEGQQINQQRTMLANQSASFYEQIMGLQIPVAPSVLDYTTKVYTFNDGVYNNEIISIQPSNDQTNDYPYQVTYKNTQSIYKASNLNKLSGSSITANKVDSTKDEYPYVLMFSGGQVDLKRIVYSYENQPLTNGESGVDSNGNTIAKNLDGIISIISKDQDNSGNINRINLDTLNNKGIYLSDSLNNNLRVDSNGHLKLYDKDGNDITNTIVGAYDKDIDGNIFSFDDSGKLTTINYSNGTIVDTSNFTDQHQIGSNMHSFDGNKITKVTDQSGNIYNLADIVDGQVIDGNKYNLDDSGNIYKITDENNIEHVFGKFGNGTTLNGLTYTVDEDGKITSISNGINNTTFGTLKDGESVGSNQYTLDDDGNIISILSNGKNHSFNNTITNGSTIGDNTYIFDVDGNISKITDNTNDIEHNFGTLTQGSQVIGDNTIEVDAAGNILSIVAENGDQYLPDGLSSGDNINGTIYNIDDNGNISFDSNGISYLINGLEGYTLSGQSSVDSSNTYETTYFKNDSGKLSFRDSSGTQRTLIDAANLGLTIDGNTYTFDTMGYIIIKNNGKTYNPDGIENGDVIAGNTYSIGTDEDGNKVLQGISYIDGDSGGTRNLQLSKMQDNQTIGTNTYHLDENGNVIQINKAKYNNDPQAVYHINGTLSDGDTIGNTTYHIDEFGNILDISYMNDIYHMGSLEDGDKIGNNTYSIDSFKNLVNITVDNGDKRVLSDLTSGTQVYGNTYNLADGKLFSISNADGTTSRFEEPYSNVVTDNDGNEYTIVDNKVQSIKYAGSDTSLTLTDLAREEVIAGNTYSILNGEITQVVDENGNIYKQDENGNLVMTDKSGNSFVLTEDNTNLKYVNAAGVEQDILVSSRDEADNYSASDKIAIDQIRHDYPSNAMDDIYYSYKVGSTTYYITERDLMEYMNQEFEQTNRLQTYYAANIDTQKEFTAAAYLSQDSDGQYTTITIDDGTPNGTSFIMEVNEVKDEDAYNEAMRKYTYEKNQYDQTVQALNAKTEQIQQQDRTLELRLKQLDTDQQAIQTEMDAVSKVIDKNIESTFKTFG